MSFLNIPEFKRYQEIYKNFMAKDDKKVIPDNISLNKNDYEYMKSLSAAVAFSSSKKLHVGLISFFVTMVLFITWAAFAEIDEIARGNGKVVPSGQNQIVQNLEGGIIQEIFVKEGDSVEKGQTLIRISNEKGISTALSNELKSYYLQAKIQRLNAELSRTPFEYTKSENEELNEFLDNENELFLTNTKQLDAKISILKEQINQKENDLKDIQQTIKHMRFAVNTIAKEISMIRPMVTEGIWSQVEFLKLLREESQTRNKLQSAILSVNKLNSYV